MIFHPGGVTPALSLLVLSLPVMSPSNDRRIERQVIPCLPTGCGVYRNASVPLIEHSNDKTSKNAVESL